MSNDLVNRLRDWETVYPEDEDKDDGCLYLEAADRIEALEVKLAKAVEALERIEDASKYFGNCPEASETTVRYAHETTRRLARTTLAELTGGQNE